VNIVVMGAGAVGGYYGARLAKAGHRVVFVARGAQASAMRGSGLTIKSGLGDLRVCPVEVVSELGTALGPVDLVIVAVKLWDSESAAAAIAPVVGAGTLVLSLQNGVDKDEMLCSVIGREHVVGAVTYIVATLAEPGVVVHSGALQRILLGELDGGRSDRVERVASALAAAGIDAEACNDIRRATWEKLVFLASTSAVTAATRGTIGEVRANPATRALLRDAMLEVVVLARAEGVAIKDDFVAGRLDFFDGLPAEGRASMAHDLARGSRLELDWLSGAVVRRAAQLGVDVPVHRTLYAALALDAQGARPSNVPDHPPGRGLAR
jgi:2-dehydropantoate 2-reductase